MSNLPTLADKEVAAITFHEHIDQLWCTGRPDKLDWIHIPLNPLNSVIRMPAKRPDGSTDYYHIKLGAEYYDLWPPVVKFIEPDTWKESTPGSKWFPSFATTPPWFALHANYRISDYTGQLVCYSFNADYYFTHGVPPESQHWQRGKHTVAATLYRLAEVLSPPYYSRPSC